MSFHWPSELATSEISERHHQLWRDVVFVRVLFAGIAFAGIIECYLHSVVLVLGARGRGARGASGALNTPCATTH